jgi:hypothetical protein
MASIKCAGPKVAVSRFALLAEADSDSEEEVAVGHSCSCESLACIHDFVSPAALAMAREVCRPRFWLWPRSVEEWDDPEVWPCCCTDPAHALDDENGKSVFTCSHGSWLMVYEPAEAVPRDEDIPWGDLISCEDIIAYAALPAVRRAEMEAERAREAKAMAAAHVEMAARREREAAETAASFAAAAAEWEAEAAKGRGHRRHSGSTSSSSAHAAAGGGAPAMPSRVPGKRYDRKTNLPMPCRCHAHEGVLGHIAPASSGINKKGEKFSYPAGCQQHDDFIAGRTKVDCPFFHIGDAEWRLLLAMSPKAGSGSWRA